MDMVALELIKNLQQLDRENEYVVFVKPDVGRDVLEETSNFKIVELKGGSYPFWEQVALPRAAAREGCDILHCTSNTAPVQSKMPLVLTLHDIIYMEKLNLFKSSGTLYQKFGNVYRRLVVSRIIQKCKKIITVSEFERKRIADFFGFDENDNRLVAIHNGVSEHFQPLSDEKAIEQVREKYSLPERFVLFLGNTDPKKNTEGVVKAYAQYVREASSPIPLLMVDYSEYNLKQMPVYAQDKNLQDHIYLPGYIANIDLPALYSMAELFLYPSLRESFGIPMLEAMACKTPVITSNTSSMPEVSEDAAKLIDPYKPQQIKEALMELLQNHSLREEFIEKGYRRASEFTWEAMARNVLQLYYDVFNQIEKK